MDKITYSNIVSEEAYKILYELVQNGKLTEYRYLREMLESEKNKLVQMMDKAPEEVYNVIIEDYLKEVKGISKLVPGLSTAIKDSKNGIELYTYDGKIAEGKEKVDENTRFDIASMTKLFTVLEALKLEEEGMFSFDRNVSEYLNGKYSNLQIPVEEMAKYYHELRTPGRLDEKDEPLTKEEITKRLSGITINQSKTFLYSDIPFIVLKEILPETDEYFKKYFNEEMKLLKTGYETYGNITGNTPDNLDKVHDPKARLMLREGITPGHAGIYSASEDLVKLFDNLRNGFLSEKSIEKMVTPIIQTPFLTDENGIVFTKNKDGEITGVKNISRAMAVYIKHPEGIRANEIPAPLGSKSFSITGFTGTYATFDLQNGLTANILANPLSSKTPQIVTIDNEEFTIRDCGKTFPNGTKLRVNGKNTEVLDGEEVVDKAPFTRITNTLKEGQIYTLLKLRLAKNSMKKMAEVMQEERLDEEVVETFTKKIK